MIDLTKIDPRLLSAKEITERNRQLELERLAQEAQDRVDGKGNQMMVALSKAGLNP